MGNCCSEDRTQTTGEFPAVHSNAEKPDNTMRQATPVGNDGVEPNHVTHITPLAVADNKEQQTATFAPEVTQNTQVKDQQLTRSQLAASYVSSQFIPVNKMNSMNITAEAKYSQLGPFTSSKFANELEQMSPRLSNEKGTYLKNIVDGSTYEGELKHGVPNGFGKLILANGGIIEGFFKDGLPNGTVRRIHPNGSVYEGKFSNHYPNGPGILIDENGRVHNVAEFKDGDMYGKTLITSANGKVLFNGTLDKNGRVGQGELFDEPTGSHYVGNFLNNHMHGKGILKKNNGYVYDGEFKSGIEHGQGTRTTVDGRIIIGTFENGRPEGICTLITDKGDELQTVWRKGVIVGKV